MNTTEKMGSSFCLIRGYNLGKKENKRVMMENMMEMMDCSLVMLVSRKVMLDYMMEMLENMKARSVSKMET